MNTPKQSPLAAPVRARPHHAAVDPTKNNAVIFLTVCTKDRAPILANDTIHKTLTGLWSNRSHWLVGRYVLLPDHAHLFATPANTSHLPLAAWVSWWKRRSIIAIGKGSLAWQKNFWDTRIRNADLYEQKWRYVQTNPVRHGLVEHAENWSFQGELYRIW